MAVDPFDNPFTGPEAPDVGPNQTITGPFGIQYDPSAVDYGQLPSDLIRDELAEMEFFRDFMGQFSGLLQNDDTKDAASEWLRVLSRYKAGEAELADLEAVDVSDLMGVEGFEDYYYENVPRPLTEDADGGFFQSILDQMPDGMREFIEDIGEDPAEVLKRILDSMPDITDQLKRGQIGVEVIFDDWKNSNVFGPFIIPGIPLPPGIIDITIQDIEDAVDAIGGTISDVLDGIKEDPVGTVTDVIAEAGTWVKDTIGDIISGVADDPFGGTLGGLGDWINDIFGNVIGGTIFSGIYDEISDLFDPDDGTLIVPGGTEDDEDSDTDADDLAERPDRDDTGLGVDLSFDDDDDDDVGGFDAGGVDVDEQDRDPTIPGDPEDEDDDDTPGFDIEENPNDGDVPGSTPPPAGGGGGGGGEGEQFGPLFTAVRADPQLLSAVQYPVTNFLTGLFTNSQGGRKA